MKSGFHTRRDSALQFRAVSIISLIDRYFEGISSPRYWLVPRAGTQHVAARRNAQPVVVTNIDTDSPAARGFTGYSAKHVQMSF